MKGKKRILKIQKTLSNHVYR